MTVTDNKLDLSARANTEKTRETRSFRTEFELREVPNGTGGTDLQFNGYACVVDRTYEMWDMFGPYEELVRPGAFTKTLQEGCDTAFLVNHEGMTLARTKPGTLALSEDGIGLSSVAKLDATSPHVIALRSAVERGDIDEMSFAFRCIRQEWSPDYMQRDLIELDLNKGDVSCVNYGANPYTSEPGMSLRGLHAMRAVRRINMREMASALKELRAGATLSSATTEVLQQVLDLVATADDAVDAAQPILAELMGVPNPDDDEDDTGDGDDGSDDSGASSTDSEAKGSNLSLYEARAKLLGIKNKRRAVA